MNSPHERDVPQIAESPQAGERGTRGLSLPVLSTGPRTPIRTSKNGPRRAVVLILVHVLFAAHLAHWFATGSTVSPVEPSESMRTLEQGEVNAGAIFFASAILATLIFGRFFCGWGCHIVAVQDLCGWIMKKCGVRPKPFRSRLLVFIPLILALYMFVWPTAKRLVVAPALELLWPDVRRALHVTPFPEQGFTNHLITEGFWDSFAPIAIAIPFIFVCGFAAVYFLGAKGFCTYGCPYGGFFGPADLITPGKIVVDDGKCHHCGHCTAVCTSNVRVHDEVRAYGMVVDPGCMKCMDCVSVCPNKALSFGFRKPALLKGKPRGSSVRRVFDTSLREDAALGVVFASVFFATRGLYDLVPMLMAVGLAGCATFIAWKSWRVIIDRDARFSIWQLKRRGDYTRAGAGLLVLASIGVLLLVHSGYVNWRTWRADVRYASFDLSKVEILSPARRPLQEPMIQRARDAANDYAAVAGVAQGGIGLVSRPVSDLRQALLRLAIGEPERALVLLEGVRSRHGSSDELTLDIGRTMILLGRAGEALALYERTLAEHPAYWGVGEQWALMTAQQGDVARAIAFMERTLERLPPERFTKTAHARTRLTLSRLYAGTGRADDAIAQIEAALDVRPRDPVLLENYAAALFQIRRDGLGAAQALTRALEIDPGHLERRLRFGQVLLMSGDARGALEQFEELERRDPANASRRAEIAAMLEAAGRAADAARFR